MRQQILEIYRQWPRHWCQMIVKNTDLWQQILQATKHLPQDSTTKTRVMTLLHGDAQCDRGNIRTRGEILTGWRFCGKTGSCACAAQQVSASVQVAAEQRSDQQKNEILQKRKLTLMQRHGVENAGQTAQAKTAHRQYYAEAANRAEQVQQQQRTLQQRYGVSNPRHIPHVNQKIADTCRSRWGANNPMQNPVIAAASGKTRRQQGISESLKVSNFTHFQHQLKNRWNVASDITLDQWRGVAARPHMKFTCIACGHEFNKRFDYASPPVCRVCTPAATAYVSSEEQAVAEYIASIYPGPVVTSDRTVINPWQLDIVLPEQKIAIEYCGLYWHSELSSGRHWQYHANKTQLCEQRGYRLITIFSDEWLNKMPIVQKKLADIVGVNHQKVFARQCEVREISRAQAREFHEVNHIQGSPRRLSTNRALYWQQQPVAVASWNRIAQNQWELTRFSSSLRVVGGASKLLRAFTRQYAPASVISFSDNRWSQGNMYQQLGFVPAGRVPPMQSYVENYAVRHHKLAFARHKILDPGDDATEWQRMQQLGFDRIWDCGKIKWSWQP